MAENITLRPDNTSSAFKQLAKNFPNQFFEKAIEDASIRIKDTLQGGTPVSDKPTQGTLKRGWSDIKKVTGGFSFQNKVPYAEFLELGLYSGVGPRTTEGVRAGIPGIFSKQARSGIMQPLKEDKQFVNSLVDGIAKEMIKEIKKILGAR